MVTYSIYVVDDDRTVRDGIAMALENDYHVEVFSSAEPAVEAVRNRTPDLVLLDIGLPDMNGIEALRRMKGFAQGLLVIMITAFEDVNTVVKAMRLGAYDYVVKPLHIDGLELRIQNALQTIRLRKEVQAIQEKYLQENLPCLVGESRCIQDVVELVKKVAQSPDTPVLIVGETGTGKELIARAVHYRSPNYNGPLVSVNCAAIPKELVESELFGYERGAFSGARSTGKKGLIEEAANGTLFLDEVADLSLEAQAKLLRFLEEGEYYRVGGTKKLHARTRIISATNKNIEAMIERELFREDLYFRISVIRVEVPSLQERSEDIIPLARHFLVEFNKKFKKHFTGISPEAEDLLRNHHWRGNIRELRNVVERALLLGSGPELCVEDLANLSGVKRTAGETQPATFPPLPPQGFDLTAVFDEAERHYIREAIKRTGGNEKMAARLLGLNHHTFRYRRRRLDAF